MPHHKVHKRIILVPQFWFMKQRVGGGGNKAGGKVSKAEFPFWNGPFWPPFLPFCWNVLYSLPSCSILLRREVCEPNSRWRYPCGAPALCASGLCARCPCPEALAPLGSATRVVVPLLFFWTFPSLSTLATLSGFFPFEKGSLLQRNGFNSQEEAGDHYIL